MLGLDQRGPVWAASSSLSGQWPFCSQVPQQLRHFDSGAAVGSTYTASHSHASLWLSRQAINGCVLVFRLVE